VHFKIQSLRIRNRWNLWLCALLEHIAVETCVTVWTDHYVAPVAVWEPPGLLYVEVVSRLNRYQFMRGLVGFRVSMSVTDLVIVRYSLTDCMRVTKHSVQYVGLSRQNLLTLLRADAPWMTALPNGRPGESRYYDRRAPKYIV
jgi:hypothetical protein